MVNLELDFIAADANQALETTKNDQEKNKKKEKKKKNETVWREWSVAWGDVCVCVCVCVCPPFPCNEIE